MATVDDEARVACEEEIFKALRDGGHLWYGIFTPKKAGQFKEPHHEAALVVDGKTDYIAVGPVRRLVKQKFVKLTMDIHIGGGKAHQLHYKGSLSDGELEESGE